MIKESEIRTIIDPVLTENNLFFVDLKISNGNKIKLEIDSLIGASVQDCVNISRIIESGLDREKEDFELEVSTPGLLSPLKVPEQFQKIVGKNVEINLFNATTLKGVFLEYNLPEIKIEIKKKIKEEGKKKKIEVTEQINILLTDIKAIKQQISFK